MTRRAMLLTGASGFVGGQALKRFLAQDHDLHLFLLIRGEDDEAVRKRGEKTLAAALGDAADGVRGRVFFLRGDLLEEGLGLSPVDRERLIHEVDHVVHSAASVDFGATLEFSRAYNLDGTRRVLELCEAIQRSAGLRRLDYVSTAYVSGSRRDVVREAELSNQGLGWANFYEQSKFEAEGLIRGWRSQGHPVSIYRPSTVVGDSRTGETSNFNVLYWPLRVYARGWWNLMIGYEDTPIDAVPVNYVADCLVTLSLGGSRTVGRDYHLCAGPEKTCTIGELATAASAAFNQRYPKFVTPEMFDKVYRPQIDKAASAAQRTLIKQGIVYMPYFVRSPLFDTTNTVSDIAGTGVEAVPRVTDYFATMFRYCIETDWGRKAKKPVGGEGAEKDPLEAAEEELLAGQG
jgi:nucleoside-diphosphate-sugar epimerase